MANPGGVGYGTAALRRYACECCDRSCDTQRERIAQTATVGGGERAALVSDAQIRTFASIDVIRSLIGRFDATRAWRSHMRLTVGDFVT
ncbi:unnamed protein product [Toxocara canis]|uniref:Transposase n=1 Tax=Toxocara canis TaxID=6265 RepID=A0A183V5J7_TOXCA|nr:unnamed protein product [Toxocara canis]